MSEIWWSHSLAEVQPWGIAFCRGVGCQKPCVPQGEKQELNYLRSIGKVEDWVWGNASTVSSSVINGAPWCHRRTANKLETHTAFGGCTKQDSEVSEMLAFVWRFVSNRDSLKKCHLLACCTPWATSFVHLLLRQAVLGKKLTQLAFNKDKFISLQCLVFSSEGKQ